MSPKQRAFARYVESRFGPNWANLDETTKNALKQAWYAGWAACQYWKNKKAR